MKRIATILAGAIMTAAAAIMVQTAGAVQLLRGDSASIDPTPIIAKAYVESGRKGLPDPNMFTHLIYAFAEFNDDCDALVIPTPEKLRAMSELKQQNPDLKVIVCVGGYKREGFSEMARDKKKRKTFVKSVKSIIDTLNLDGVDLDWEFPTTEAGGHTATPKDAGNYVKVVKELRKALGKGKEISFYSNNSGKFIDLKGMVPYVDYVHASGYNLSVPKEGERAYHQSPLYPSEKLGGWCVKKSMERHLEYGVPREKLLLGMPFFGRGKSPFPSYLDCNKFDEYAGEAQLLWSDEAQAPYYADGDGNLVMGFDDERAIKAKVDFVRVNGMPGVFVWNYDSDYDDHRLGKCINAQCTIHNAQSTSHQ